MVLGVSGGNLENSTYGNIRRIGLQKNGRVIYAVIDSDGKDAGKLTIPSNEVDTFEKSYKEILTTAPKIKKYVSEHSSEKDLRWRRTQSMLSVTTGGLLGAAIPIFLTRNKSTLSQIVSTVVGIVTGLSLGFMLSLNASTPPDSYKFAKAAHNLSKLDVQKFEE